MATRLDLYQLHRSEYVAPGTPVLITAKPAKYLAVSGSGKPGGQDFTAAIGALYSVAFTIKMASKFAGRDYAVSKLECLWWGTPDKRGFPIKNWQLLIRTPGFITPARVRGVQKELLARGKPPEVGLVKLIALKEGRAVQMLHVGPYDEEQRTMDVMHTFATSRGLRYAGKHHEIYLSDPRRVPAARLKTILRQPVRT
ncbi:MAG TPA: GyrI-like domain-containing protein [Vicinamibacterales bacterium]|nr:GyrI-like domain-containing protein [Vicinamibacterales bacterium]